MKIFNRALSVFIIIWFFSLILPFAFCLSADQDKKPAAKAATAEDHYRIWREYFDKGEYEYAIPFMKKAIEIDPAYVQKIRDHIETSIEEELVYAAFAEGKGSAEDYYRMWLKFFDTGRYEDSIPFMRKAIELNPAYAQKIRDHVEVSIEEELISEEVMERTATAEDYYKVWREYFDRGEYEDSMPFMKKAIELDPAYAQKIRDRVEESIEKELIYEAISEGTATAEDFYKIWREYFDKGEYQDAIPFMKKAIELNPAYSQRIKRDIDQAEGAYIAQIDIEAKRREILAKETARELIEKGKGKEEASLGGFRPIKFGPLTINPSIGYKIIWDDNIYLTYKNRIGDLIMLFSPNLGAKLDLPFALPFIVSGTNISITNKEAGDHTLFNLEYRTDVKSYLHYNRESNVGHTFIATSVIPSNLFGGRGKLVLGFKDIFRFTTDPATSEETKFFPRYHNEMEFKGKYTPTEKISMAITYLNILEQFKSNAMAEFDYDKYILTNALYYNVTPKTSFFVDTDLAKIIYKTGNRDSIFMQISSGVVGNVTPKTTVYLKAGAQIRTYTHNDIYGDYRALTARASMSTQLRKDTFMKLMLCKDAYESIYEENAYFDLKYAELELMKQLTGKMSVAFSGSFGRNDYPRSSDEGELGVRRRRDFVWGLKGGFSYRLLKWLDSSATYEFRGRESNFDKYNYSDNRVIADVKASY